MREVGLGVGDRQPRLLTTELGQWADIVITLGCGDSCPVIPRKRYIEWDVTEPKALAIDKVRAIRDEIAARVDDLVRSLDEVDVGKGLVT